MRGAVIDGVGLSPSKNEVPCHGGNDFPRRPGECRHSSQVNFRPQWWHSASQAQKSRRAPQPGQTVEYVSIRRLPGTRPGRNSTRGQCRRVGSTRSGGAAAGSEGACLSLSGVSRFFDVMTNALIWDCDGVLVDSEKHSCGAWLPVLRRRGIEVDLAYIETFIGRSDADLLAELHEQHGLTVDDAIRVERQEEYFRQATGATEAFPGLADLLARLRAAGVPMAVASSGQLSKIRFSLGQAGLDGIFDILCSATEVERGKPAPDLFLLAAERLGVSPADCAVIEDSVPGLQGAAAAGMRPIGFTSSHPEPLLREAGADDVFDDYAQLPALLRLVDSPI